MEPLIYELSVPGRVGVDMPESDVPHFDVPSALCRKDFRFPEVSQIDVTRHFTRLSRMNMSIDTNMYPLGSCTMKYNPRINEDAARLSGLAMIHPLQPIEGTQGALYLMHQLQDMLREMQRHTKDGDVSKVRIRKQKVSKQEIR